MAENNFQFSSSTARDPNELPSNFKFLMRLGAGSFGKVVRCLKKDTNQIVAIKIPKFLWKDSTEVTMMEKLMRLNMDEHNIVQFFGWFHTSCGKAMVFQNLDISLQDFILERDCAPMLLSDVRTIIEQLATAFNALSLIEVIHSDLKLDNIMMVHHRRRPYNVKLIDFGLAMHRSETKQGMTLQVPSFRAPEIILGLPFSVPIDIWSLGCSMAVMLHGAGLFPRDNEYEALHDIIALLGVPEDHLLDSGLKTRKYFTQSKCNGWRLKTHDEYSMEDKNQQPYKKAVRYRLDDMRKLRLEDHNKSEAVQRAQCIDLLEAMLCLDEAKRITPCEILTHPFLTSSQPLPSPPRRIEVSPAPAENTLLQDGRGRIQDLPDINRPLPPPPCRIKVCSASVESMLLQDGPGRIQDLPHNSRPLPPPCSIKICSVSVENTLLQDGPSRIQVRPNNYRPLPPPPCRNQVCPADTMVLMDIDDEISEEPPATTATPPGVIFVRPAAARNTLELKEDKERASRLPAGMNETGGDPMARTHDCAGTQKQAEQKKKKKKNCVRRLFSWMKRTFGSC